MKDKIGILSVERVWFETEEERKTDVTRITRVDLPETDKWYVCNEKAYTVMSNLSLSEEELLKGMRKKVRYEVTRAEKEELAYSIYDSEELKKCIEVVDQFEKAYLHFASSFDNKIVLKAYSRKKIDLYIQNNCLLLTCMKKENLTVYHMYVFDKNETVLIYSVSDFRDDNIDNNLAGRANKLLHFYDMKYFKTLGLQRYDWGNISSKDNPNGIDNFKISFGGVVQDKYNILIGNTLLGKIFVLVYKAFIRRGK